MNTVKDEQYYIEGLQNIDLTADTTRKFENALTDLVMGKEEKKADDSEPLLAILNDRNQPDDVRYACFIMASTYHRRNKNHHKLEKLFKEYGDDFTDYKSFEHYSLLKEVDTGYRSDWEELLNRARKNANVMNNPGSRHMYAEFVAMIFEDDASDKDKMDNWVNSALNYVDAAIGEQENYAKFYATRGRLQALKGEYEKAEASINKAIMLEDSKKSDYAIRIGSYQIRLLAIRQQLNNNRMHQAIDEYEKKMDDAIDESKALMQKSVDEANSVKEDVKDSLIRNLEYLGIFAGIISFTMGSISIASSVVEKEDGTGVLAAAGLIIVLFGALCGAYFVFDLIIHGINKDKKVQYIITAIIVLAGIIGGLMLLC